MMLLLGNKYWLLWYQQLSSRTCLTGKTTKHYQKFLANQMRISNVQVIYLGKDAIVRGFASHYNIFSKFVYLLVYISNTMISVV